MFPRLLYVGDVPVESSYHGSALLHRLLSDYPPDKLTILETATKSETHRRLPGVNYVVHPIGKSRWLNTRLHSYALVWFTQAGTTFLGRVSVWFIVDVRIGGLAFRCHCESGSGCECGCRDELEYRGTGPQGSG